MKKTIELSVVIPTFRRPQRLCETLDRVLQCDPMPAEIIVHIDAGDNETAPVLLTQFPQVKLLFANTRQGPGGGRNRLISNSSHEIIISLDDDSFPIDRDFFSCVHQVIVDHPKAGIIAMTVINDGDTIVQRDALCMQAADFQGCACAYRRSMFIKTTGYIPLHPAYGMEETDVALQFLDAGFGIVRDFNLRIRHAHDNSRGRERAVIAGHIANTALLVFLRYPFRWWPLGALQVINRVFYSVRRTNLVGALLGLFLIPSTIIRHAGLRSPVAASTIAEARQIRRTTLHVAREINSA